MMRLYVNPTLVFCHDTYQPWSWNGICHSFEHDAVDIEDEGESTKEAPPNISDKALPSSASAITPSTSTSSKPALQTTVWNAKVKLVTEKGKYVLAAAGHWLADTPAFSNHRLGHLMIS
jgi:hypothetical protein